jgi:hypothetical protein
MSDNRDPRSKARRAMDVARGKCVGGARACAKIATLPLAAAFGAAGVASIPVGLGLPTIPMMHNLAPSNHPMAAYSPLRAHRLAYGSWAQMANENFANKVRKVVAELDRRGLTPQRRAELLGKLHSYRNRMHRDEHHHHTYPRHRGGAYSGWRSKERHDMSRDYIQKQIDRHQGRR